QTEAEGHADRAHDHGQAREPVDAGVLAVGHERRRADPPPGPDAGDGHPFVSDKADHPGDRHREQVAGGRESRKAAARGSAVSASPRLCTVSARSATEPESTTTTICRSAVAPRMTSERRSVRSASWLPRMEALTPPWACPPPRCWFACAWPSPPPGPCSCRIGRGGLTRQRPHEGRERRGPAAGGRRGRLPLPAARTP